MDDAGIWVESYSRVISSFMHCAAPCSDAKAGATAIEQYGTEWYSQESILSTAELPNHLMQYNRSAPLFSGEL
jgi:hypothetical protein